MIDLVDELRAAAPPRRHVGDCMVRAADEIERLRTAMADVRRHTDTSGIDDLRLPHAKRMLSLAHRAARTANRED